MVHSLLQESIRERAICHLRFLSKKGSSVKYFCHSKVFEAVGGRWKMATCLFAVKLAAQLQKAVSQLGLCPDGYDHQDHH
jgi:hypothetical protein